MEGGHSKENFVFDLIFSNSKYSVLSTKWLNYLVSLILAETSRLILDTRQNMYRFDNLARMN
jgi:hypothetical protein